MDAQNFSVFMRSLQMKARISPLWVFNSNMCLLTQSVDKQTLQLKGPKGKLEASPSSQLQWINSLPLVPLKWFKWMREASKDASECLYCIWKGVGALINSSQKNVGASFSLSGTNKNQPFTQFSTPIDVAEKEVGSEEL